MKTLIPKLVIALCFAAFLAGPQRGEAQFTAKVFTAKFLCGYMTGDVPNLDDGNPFPLSYEDVTPGAYSSLVTIINAGVSLGAQSFTASLAIRGFNDVLLANVTLNELRTEEAGCPLIVATLESALGLTLDGEFIQGYLIVEAAGDTQFEVHATYTYTSQNTTGAGPEGLGLGTSVAVERIPERVIDIIG